MFNPQGSFKHPAATLSLALALIATTVVRSAEGGEKWRGLAIVPENRCQRQ